MELRYHRRAFVNGASVSAIRLQSLTHLTLRTPPRGFVVYRLLLRAMLVGKGFTVLLSFFFCGGMSQNRGLPLH